MDLYSPWTPVTCHDFLFWNLTQTLISVPVSVRLVFIADSHQGDQSTHGGLFNYTVFLHVSVNNPTDAIIHVAISINTFKEKCSQTLGHVTEARHQFYGIVTPFILLSGVYQPFTLNLFVKWVVHKTLCSDSTFCWMVIHKHLQLWKKDETYQIFMNKRLFLI